MKPITLETLETKHKEFGDLISKFKSEFKTAIVLPEFHIETKHGENWAGMIVGKDGNPSYHLILLAEDKENIKWQDAVDWAKSIGGELPTRCEQSLLFSNLKEEFQDKYYWSIEQHASNSDYAWCQDFGSGGQSYYLKLGTCRARAVRRLVIE